MFAVIHLISFVAQVDSVTLIEIAALIGGPVVAGLFSVLIERVPQFQSLSGTGKALLNSTFSLVAGLTSALLVGYLTTHADIVASAQPVLNLVVPALSVFVNQLVHLFLKTEKQEPPFVIGDV